MLKLKFYRFRWFMSFCGTNGLHRYNNTERFALRMDRHCTSCASSSENVARSMPERVE